MDEQKQKDEFPKITDQMMSLGLKPILCSRRDGYRVWVFPPYSREKERQTTETKDREENSFSKTSK